jgi:hypothetical protein
VPQWLEATRLQLVCPCGTRTLFLATNRIIALLLAEETVQQFGGCTYSTLDPPVFIGQFWHVPSMGHGGWDEDRNVLITIDVPGQTAEALLLYFSTLRERVNAIYAEAGEQQKALWITAQPLAILME